MTTGQPAKKQYEEEGWQCTTCYAPVRLWRSVLKNSEGLSAKVLFVERSCYCDEDKIMHKRRGLFLSPDKV